MIRRVLISCAIATSTACTCGSSPTIEGHVVDLWGNPVENADISVEGTEGAVTTDKDGNFSVPMADTISLHITREGIIERDTEFSPENTEETAHITIDVVPEPETPGFHLVGPESYLPLPAQPVVRTGTDLKAWHGVRSTGDVAVDGEPFRVVFHAPDLKLDEVARLRIELDRLAFIESTEVDSVEGPAPVDVNLWISGGEVAMTREPLGGGRNYVYRVVDLPKGSYAFVSMDLLNAKSAGFDKVAPAVRNVHTFSIE